MVLLEYRAARRLVCYKKRKAKSVYYENRLASVKDSGELWRILGKMGLTKTRQKLATAFFEEDELANYYAGLQTRFPASTTNDIHELLNSTPVDTERPTFKFIHTNSEEVLASLKKVLAKSCGSSPDGLSITYFKNHLHMFADYFAQLYNRCFDVG